MGIKKLIIFNMIALLIIGKFLHYFFTLTEDDENFFVIKYL